MFGMKARRWVRTFGTELGFAMTPETQDSQKQRVAAGRFDLRGLAREAKRLGELAFGKDDDDDDDDEPTAPAATDTFGRAVMRFFGPGRTPGFA